MSFSFPVMAGELPALYLSVAASLIATWGAPR